MVEATLENQLANDLKTAMKSGDTTARDTIRFTMASLKNARIDKGDMLTDAEIINILQREAKRRQESIDQFRAAGRTDLVEKEEAELAIVQRYLPVQLTDDEVDHLVRQAIADNDISDPKELGKLMPLLIRLADGRADGKRLNAAARAALSQS